MLTVDKAIARATDLDVELRNGRKVYRKLKRYYAGDHDLPPGPRGAKEAYQRLLKESVTNWMRLIVDVVSERMQVQGFRASDSDPAADSPAWKDWQANKLDQASRMVHTEMLKLGLAAVSVMPGEGGPVIRGESPLQVFIEFDDEDVWKPRAVWKSWTVGKGRRVGTLYLPVLDEEDEDDQGGIYRLQAKKTAGDGWSSAVGASAWESRRLDPRDPESWCDENPLGDRLPFVAFPNMPDLEGDWTSEIENVISIQDRINETIFNRMVAAEFAAFRQRWVTGLKVPVDPETNQPVEPFNAAINKLWIAEKGDVKFGEFSESDLAGYIGAVEADVQHLAALTRTPPHYLLGQSGNFPSGESLKATEAGLMAKVGQRLIDTGEAWEEVMRLAALCRGDQAGADDMASQVIWAKKEARTESELVAALVQLKTLGVPDEALWELYGADPKTIERWRAMATEQDSMGALAQLLQMQTKPPVDDPAKDDPAAA